MVWHDTRICPCLSRSITGRANRTEKVMNFVVIFFKKEIDEFLSNMFWNHQDLRRAFSVVCFACYKPADPLQRIVDTVQEGGRDFTGGMPTGAGPGRPEQVDSLAADASVSRYPRRHHAQGRAIRGRPSTWLGLTARVPSTVRQRSLLSPHPNWRRTGSRSQHCSTSNFKFATLSVVVSEILDKVNWRCNIAVFQTFAPQVYLPISLFRIVWFYIYPERWWYAALYWVK